MLAKFFLTVIRRLSSFVTRPEKFLFLALNIVAVNRREVVAHGNFYPTVLVGKINTAVRLVNVAEFAFCVVADNQKAQTLVFVAGERVVEHGSIAARISERKDRLLADFLLNHNDFVHL